MSAIDRIDPELRPSLDVLREQFPGGVTTMKDLLARRSALAELVAKTPQLAELPVAKEDRRIPSLDGGPDLSVRIYRPTETKGRLPGIYNIHGGGMIVGNVEVDDAFAESLCVELPAVVVSVDYRLAPEDPYPAPVEDCFAGYLWMASHSEELGFDPDRVAIYGASAGGGLALAVTLLARDRGAPRPCFQMALCPMVDPRSDTPSSHEIKGDLGSWDRSSNIKAWEWYLAGREPDAYAAPALAGDLSGLPSTFIDVGTVDLFRDEDIEFAVRLMQAGVPTELTVYPGVYHGAESVAPNARVAQRIRASRIEALRRALAPKADS